jgi:integrase
MLDRGIPVIDGKRTLGEWLDHYLGEIVAPRVRPSTYKTREYMIRTYLKPYLGRKVLRDLAPMDVERFLHDLVKAGHTPNLANQARQVLVTALNQAVKRDLIYRNPAALVERLREEPIRPGRAIAIPHISRLLEFAQRDRIGVCYILMLALGLRPMEAVAIRWSDIDYAAATLTIERQITRHPYGNETKPKVKRRGREPKFNPPTRKVMAPPKTRSSVRLLPLLSFIGNLLKAHKAAQAKERLIRGPVWSDHDLVFCTTLGTPLEHGAVQTRFKRILRAADLPDYQQRDLRTSCASLLGHLKVDPAVIALILGHRDASTTTRYYLKALPESVVNAGAEFDRFLSGQKEFPKEEVG